MKYRREIEVVVPRAHLEANARRAVVLDEQLTVAEDAMDKVGRRMIHDDDIDSQTERSLEIVGDVELQVVQGLRCAREEQGEVDVARGRGGPSRLAPEEVGGDETIDPRKSRGDEVPSHLETIARRARAPAERSLPAGARSRVSRSSRRPRATP